MVCLRIHIVISAYCLTEQIHQIYSTVQFHWAVYRLDLCKAFRFSTISGFRIHWPEISKSSSHREKSFRKLQKGSIIRPEGFVGDLKHRGALAVGQIKELEEDRNQIAQEVKLYMKDYETAFNDTYQVTWKNVESVCLNNARIKEERPEIYQDSHCCESRFRQNERCFSISSLIEAVLPDSM